MKVLITGATGAIGSEIVKLCHIQNIEVHYLTTRKEKLEQHNNYKGFYWNPELTEIDTGCFNGVDAIIHLAGANVSRRWTTSYKQEILDSRVKVTRFLYESLKKQPHKIKQIISASAIGIYPDSLVNYYDEQETQTDDSFLGKVVNEWEEAVDSFKNLGIKTAKVRIGLVLSTSDGALPQMVKPIKYGLGVAFGHGNQWQSWIHIEDLAQLFIFILNKNLAGIYNGVAPNPVTNKELTKAIAKVVNRPILLPNIPKPLMKLILGEMHILLFLSQRVSSKKIEDLGFEFKFHHLMPALDNLL